MDDDERRSLATALARAKDPALIRETVRLAESFLTAQLQAGLAADLRAMTLAAVLAAIIGGLLGGIATIVAAAEVKLGLHLISILVFTTCLVVALFNAVYAARPTFFDYAGNNPKFFVEDVEQEKNLNQVLAEQAAYYARSIEANNDCIDENHRCLKRALDWVLVATVLGMGAEVVIILGYVGRSGFGLVF
jgi:hypothetical protein